MSSVISIRVTDEEKSILEEYSKFYNCPVSTMMKEYTLKYLEDQFDLKAIQDYENNVKKGRESLTSWKDFKKDIHENL